MSTLNISCMVQFPIDIVFPFNPKQKEKSDQQAKTEMEHHLSLKKNSH